MSSRRRGDRPAPSQGGTPEIISGALFRLRSGLADLAQHLQGEDRKDLTAASAALERIVARRDADRPPAEDDPTRLQRLLELAGPQDAPELLRRIRTDLDSAARQIELALPQDDRAALRAASHVLIAVGGSVGALRLASAARTLNTAAHAEAQPGPGPASGAAPGSDPEILAGLAQPVLAAVAQLSCRLASLQHERS